MDMGSAWEEKKAYTMHTYMFDLHIYEDIHLYNLSSPKVISEERVHCPKFLFILRREMNSEKEKGIYHELRSTFSLG